MVSQQKMATRPSAVALIVLLFSYVVYLKWSVVVSKQEPDIGRTVWRFVAVTDRDDGSKHTTKPERWEALLVPGFLTYNETDQLFDIVFGAPTTLHTRMSVKGRSMELSGIEFFQDQLLAICDRSGAIFSVHLSENLSGNAVYVEHMLRAGNGTTALPFKAEWWSIHC